MRLAWCPLLEYRGPPTTRPDDEPEQAAPRKAPEASSTPPGAEAAATISIPLWTREDEVQETACCMASIQYNRGQFEEESIFPHRRGIREGEFLDMMDCALFASLEYDQLVDMQWSMSQRQWRSIAWLSTRATRDFCSGWPTAEQTSLSAIRSLTISHGVKPAGTLGINRQSENLGTTQTKSGRKATAFGHRSVASCGKRI